MPSLLADRVHQVLSIEGKVVGQLPDLPADRLIDFYRWMVLGRIFSDRMVNLQRQGRIGTFGPINGQEAASVGLAAAMQEHDWLVGSYREILAYLVKGVPLPMIIESYRGSIGTRFPPELHCLPIQIVLAAQMLHAVGIAMAIKYDGAPHVVVGVCGDGATSEGDFNEALNFAGVFKVPAVLVVQNNGWAISVPRASQSAAAYLAHRGPGFGLPGYLVDGNDVLAVYQVISDCVARARAGDGPSLVEALTYRLGAHTTADDPAKYRSEAEVREWQLRDPLPRYRRFLMDRALLDEGEDEQIHAAAQAHVQDAVATVEALPPPDPAHLFDLVYAEPTPQLRQQRQALLHDLHAGEAAPGA